MPRMELVFVLFRALATAEKGGELHSINKITIQIHQLELKFNGITQAENVPVVAVWVPDRFSAPIVHED